MLSTTQLLAQAGPALSFRYCHQQMDAEISAPVKRNQTWSVSGVGVRLGKRHIGTFLVTTEIMRTSWVGRNHGGL